MFGPLVSELVAERVTVALTRRVLKLFSPPYYRWLAANVTDAELAKAYREDVLLDARHDDPGISYCCLIGKANDAGEVM